MTRADETTLLGTDTTGSDGNSKPDGSATTKANNGGEGQCDGVGPGDWLNELVTRTADDPGAPLEDEAAAQLFRLYNDNLADFARAEQRLIKAGCPHRLLNKKLREFAQSQHTTRLSGAEANAKVEAKAAVLQPDIEPWDEPVAAHEVLTAIVSAIQFYVVVDDHLALTVALWILHCHCIEAFDYSPRLYVHSPVKRCGKTTLMRVIKRLVPRALSLTGCSAALLFRCIGPLKPTLLLDEADNYGLERNEDLRIVFNSGVLRGAQIGRTVGEDHEPMFFPIFAPLAFAGINNNKVPGPTLDRSITIGLRRKLKEDRRARFDRRKVGYLIEICRKAMRFAADNGEALANADPVVPDALNDRELDGWRPLLAIADMAGPELAEAARTAAAVLSGSGDNSDDDPALMLLNDCRQIFKDVGGVVEDAEGTFKDVISSKTLGDRLANLEDRPWAQWGRTGKPISLNTIARYLRRYDIRSGNIGPKHGRAKGYQWAAFADAWKRYAETS